MNRRPSPSLLLLLALRQLAPVLVAVFSVVVTLWASVVFAQEAVANQHINMGPPLLGPVPATAPTSTTGWLMIAALGVVGSIAAWAGVQFTLFLKSKTEQAKAGTASAMGWSLVNRVWLKGQATVSKVAAKNKVLMEKILSDGKVTHEEFLELQQAVSRDLLAAVLEEAPLLEKLLGIFGKGGVADFVDGIAARVTHSLVTGKQEPITPQPDAKKPDAPPIHSDGK